MKLYNDIFIRKNLTDQGVVPATGAYTNTPDIIVSGNMPINNPVQYAKDTWEKNPGINPIANSQNYIYVRGKNLAPKKQSGHMALYYTKATLIMYPNQWLNNKLKNSNGKEKNPIEAKNTNDIVITTNPFTWIPEMIKNDHFCLVGMVDTKEHPMPKPTTDNMKDLATFIYNHPNMAWHNVCIVDNGVNFSVQIDYNQGTVDGLIYIFLECTACPDGSEVSFASGTPLADGTYVKQDWVEIKGCNPTTKQHFIVGATFNIPANWETNITYNYKNNGKAPLSGENWNIELKAAFYTPKSELTTELLSLADNSDHAITQANNIHNILMSTGNEKNTSVGPGKMIGIGSHKTQGKQ